MKISMNMHLDLAETLAQQATEDLQYSVDTEILRTLSPKEYQKSLDEYIETRLKEEEKKFPAREILICI